MTAYYNEFDPYAAAWLRNLISAGHIAPGDVDERSIVEVQADDLKSYTQCHFFAGIGGWSLALRLAGWPDDEPVWTGSCPCQPFSAAGKRKGTADERHLWPEFRRLIAECRPAVVFGEQVAGKDGRTWLAGVRADLEGLAYAVGAADLSAASVGAPHIRQRLWWVADASDNRRDEQRREAGQQVGARQRRNQPDDGGVFGRLAYADGGLARHGDLQPCGQHGQQQQQQEDGRVGGLGDAAASGRTGRDGAEQQPGRRPGPGCPAGWHQYDVVHCTDGKARRFEPGSFPLAHGVSNRVGRLRAYGNAIVPEVAAEFIQAYRDIRMTGVSYPSHDGGVFD